MDEEYIPTAESFMRSLAELLADQKNMEITSFTIKKSEENEKEPA